MNSAVVKYHELFSETPQGLQRIMAAMNAAECATNRYKELKKQLQNHRQDLIFCTTQRATQAIATVLAANDLVIKTASWIYGWDDLPKGMTATTTDYYFVSSELMKEQLLAYYPNAWTEQISVIATPQFEPHYDASLLLSRKQFADNHGLQEQTKYVCFSGDATTSPPPDHYYLENTAQAVRRLNEEGPNVAIIYHKVSVDTTGRYDAIRIKYKDVITVIDPLWKPTGAQWNQVTPTKEDFALLANICHHCELVVNICSSMVFDFSIDHKPTMYPNYEQPQLKNGIRDIGQNYSYVHFHSMPDYDTSVIWAMRKEEIHEGIKGVLYGSLNTLPVTKKWYGIINKTEEPQHACARIWEGIRTVL